MFRFCLRECWSMMLYNGKNTTACRLKIWYVIFKSSCASYCNQNISTSCFFLISGYFAFSKIHLLVFLTVHGTHKTHLNHFISNASVCSISVMCMGHLSQHNYTNVLNCSFLILNALTLLAWQHEGHLTCKNYCHESVSDSAWQHGASTAIVTGRMQSWSQTTRQPMQHQCSLFGPSWQCGGSLLSPVRNTVILQCFDAVGWASGRASACTATTITRRLLSELAWCRVTPEKWAS